MRKNLLSNVTLGTKLMTKLALYVKQTGNGMDQCQRAMVSIAMRSVEQYWQWI